MGFGFLSHLKTASAEVSAWHMAALRSQSIQWSMNSKVNVNQLAIGEKRVPAYLCGQSDDRTHVLSYWDSSVPCNSTGEGVSRARC